MLFDFLTGFVRTHDVVFARGNHDWAVDYESVFSDLRKKVGADARTGDDAPIDTSHIGTVEHLAACLGGSLEMVVALLAEERV